MAKQTKSRQSRSGDSRKSGQRQKKGVGSKKGGSNSSDDGGNMSKAAEAQTGGKPMGRAPVEEPDVWVNVRICTSASSTSTWGISTPNSRCAPRSPASSA